MKNNAFALFFLLFSLVYGKRQASQVDSDSAELVIDLPVRTPHRRRHTSLPPSLSPITPIPRALISFTVALCLSLSLDLHHHHQTPLKPASLRSTIPFSFCHSLIPIHPPSPLPSLFHHRSHPPPLFRGALFSNSAVDAGAATPTSRSLAGSSASLIPGF
ncbi:hypothetical protein PIB30_000613 [Stylosanthes scabra]|uniref:Uncharacterized protein n=1 Tax=Stylosanthes scabra TaxID=79078 RepID=A0ABU6X2D7_9FABA|nr:hypothetical protein [Stylosanthes scabra]